MIKFAIKSLILTGILVAIAFITMGVTTSFRDTLSDNFSLIFILPGLGAAMVWIFTKIIVKIANSLSFVYWLFCVGLSITIYVLSLSNGSFFGLFAIHIVGLLFFIPEMAGETTTYLNTETYFDGNGDIVSEKSWTSSEYTPGCVRKLVTMVIIAAIFSFLETQVSGSFVLIIFLAELIYSAVLAIINLKYFFVW